MPMHIAARELGGSLYHFSLLKVFVCFIKQACLLAISSIFWGVIIAFNG
jgi:hypothetical protein